MAISLKPNERLVCIGSTAQRAPDGTPYPSVPMYIIVEDSDVDPTSGLSAGEAELYEDIAGILAAKFKQYVDGVKASEREAAL